MYDPSVEEFKVNDGESWNIMGSGTTTTAATVAFDFTDDPNTTPPSAAYEINELDDNKLKITNMLLESSYSLHGVFVTEEIATTPAELLDPRIILEQNNAEVRHVVVRKIGIERVLKSLNAEVVDHQGLYQLVNLDLGDGRYRPYLKMLNPSTEEIHIEGVHPRIGTVKSALMWRNGTDEVPEQLT